MYDLAYKTVYYFYYLNQRNTFKKKQCRVALALHKYAKIIEAQFTIDRKTSLKK